VNFSEKLIRMRKSEGLSQDELADRLEVSRQAVSRWENGSTFPDLPNLQKIVRLFGVSADYLICDEYTAKPGGEKAPAARQEKRKTKGFYQEVRSVKTVFEHTRARGGCLTEVYADGAWSMNYRDRYVQREMSVYSLAALDEKQEYDLWGGMTPEQLLASGPDLLGRYLLKQGEPSYEGVRRLLPPLTEKTYAFLGGNASWWGLIVNTETGVVYPQHDSYRYTPAPVFDPRSVDPVLGAIPPRQWLLNGKMPLMFSVHASETAVLEFMYFVEPGDPDADPALWIRIKRYRLEDPTQFAVEYRMAGLSREIPDKPLPEGLFLDAMSATVAFWLRFEKKGTRFNLPEKQLERVVDGTQMALAVTFAGDHTHYGHCYYGHEYHDHFPPNFCWSLELLCLTNRTAWAKRIFTHMMTVSVTDEGRITYRLGDQELYGASAAEYGMLLFLFNRYRYRLGVGEWEEEIWEKIIGMGRLILDHCIPCPAEENRVLVMMCAEADTNTRVNAYVNNNLWSIVGLNALTRLLNECGRPEETVEFAQMAALLENNVRYLMEKESIFDPRFGKLPPFRFGYTAAPATLSVCRDTFTPMTEEEYAAYTVFSAPRGESGAQDLLENNYANYRYYPEMLSSMLLEPEQAEAIRTLRENLGGEILGMTRFKTWVDNWPVLHYARNLLENGHVDKYLMLLYAHTCHHGLPELMCYYEQVKITGEMKAVDCVPALLTTPTMVAWMFAYETMNSDTLTLLPGIPKAWFDTGFSVERLGWSGGTVSLTVRGNTVSVEFSAPTEREVELVWRRKDNLSLTDVESGGEAVIGAAGNRLTLKAGITRAELRFRD